MASTAPDQQGIAAGTATATTAALAASNPSSALHNFRLLAALRSNNPQEVQPYLDDLKNAPPDAGPGRVLGMAVQVASVPIIELILKSPSLSSPNLPVTPNSTTTALHIASEIGRLDAVELLLKDPRTDDTLKDDKGRTPLECASNVEVANLIEQFRAAYQARYMKLLANYISSPLSSVEESSKISAFIEQPRAESLNLNALDERSGLSLLHEAARRRDLRLVELAVKRGADVFVRDRKGKRVLEHDKGADERIKAYLRQFSNQDSLIQPKSDGRPPDLKGFLSKWVNYRQGWRTRWFVLENGVLSYYRNREDEQIACRGSIALATANLHPSSDGSRFEVSSAASTSVPKMIVKSSARGEIARWVQAIRLNMEYYQSGKQTADAGAGVKRVPSNARSIAPSIRSVAPERALGTQLSELPPADGFLHPGLKRSATGASGVSSKSATSPRVGRPPSGIVAPRNREASPTGGNTSDAGSSAGDHASLDERQSETIPHESEFELGMNNLKAQLELTEQLVGSIVTPPSPPSSVHGSPDPSRAPPSSSRQQEVKDAIRTSLATVISLVQRQHDMTLDREQFFSNRIAREVQARKLWEDNLLAVAQQQAETDRQLTEAAKDNEKKRRALRQARGVLAEISMSNPTSPVPEGATHDPMISAAISHSPERTLSHELPPAGVAPPLLQQSLRNSLSRGTGGRRSISISNSMSRASFSVQDVNQVVAAIDDSEDDDDEFFDAIETGTIPNLKLYDSIANPERPATPTAEAPAPPKEGTIAQYLGRKSLEPYSHVRHRLPIDDDKRPSVSLWSILKSSIGKDLTKITFPVNFNECTSMLQRMAEDMEYDACLTVAASERDSLKRIAFVAAFAMSNYSSTIGRVAKPFNPLLSQSFEYAIPNRYRYISEQVSHHPPISACYSEAPTWKYYGEVDAKNKFQGRYFEIRPTGMAHCELIIPREWVKPGLNYPSAGPEYPEGYVVEHYSWKKVITNVSNFIMGTPIIDHYGDLTVTNHRTGETSTLTFKPRSWRGKDAFEIKGNVLDANGNPAWEIAGRWDSQLIARQAGIASAPLDVNEEVAEDTTEYMQLWRNTEKPAAPFNLTPYAVTLNDIPNGLEQYLAPTDCRLRTDQRAFENADYDRAQDLKTANEEKQRETRRLRAEGKLPPHEPRWFSPQTDEDTGERVWVPRRASDGEVKFWHDRELQGDRPREQKWPEVDHIFVDDP